MDTPPLVEHLREALVSLYDPPALAQAALGEELVRRGRLRSAHGLYTLLLESIDQLKPPPGAPTQSTGWRHYRYLQLRYVDCASHESIAQEFGVSSRHAARIHQDALLSLATVLFPNEPGRPPPLSVKTPSHSSVFAGAATHRLNFRTGAPSIEGLAPFGPHLPDEVVDVLEVVRSVCDTLIGITTAHRVRLEIVVADHLPAVRANRVYLRQSLLNLLLGLIQPVHDCTIRVYGEEHDDDVVIRLQRELSCEERASPDEPSADTDALFQAARQLARAQSTTIDETVGPERGFRFRLRVSDLATVLVVDDNPDIGDLFRRVLLKSRYHPLHARTVDRALRHIQERKPDIIILDVVMPARDGWEILTAFRQEADTANIPIIVCSVLPDRELALSLGAAAFLRKPVTRSALIPLLDQLTPPRGEPP